mmetsp:Transcript_18862/g.54542  ORF Transcript_18862/g.54542 Transcript_18862/m.54542 type:complete len:446 (+) Transcript_18862:1114-2451(+)
MRRETAHHLERPRSDVLGIQSRQCGGCEGHRQVVQQLRGLPCLAELRRLRHIFPRGEQPPPGHSGCHERDFVPVQGDGDDRRAFDDELRPVSPAPHDRRHSPWFAAEGMQEAASSRQQHADDHRQELRIHRCKGGALRVDAVVRTNARRGRVLRQVGHMGLAGDRRLSEGQVPRCGARLAHVAHHRGSSERLGAPWHGLATGREEPSLSGLEQADVLQHHGRRRQPVRYAERLRCEVGSGANDAGRVGRLRRNVGQAQLGLDVVAIPSLLGPRHLCRGVGVQGHFHCTVGRENDGARGCDPLHRDHMRCHRDHFERDHDVDEGLDVPLQQPPEAPCGAGRRNGEHHALAPRRRVHRSRSSGRLGWHLRGAPYQARLRKHEVCHQVMGQVRAMARRAIAAPQRRGGEHRRIRQRGDNLLFRHRILHDDRRKLAARAVLAVAESLLP